ncbi:hypothetical protein CPB86DRAFT_786931 [Serendipita vermifera]|nr:hypothetical protein CPB86DRAFT_786931 [Serendipita vermifera]
MGSAAMFNNTILACYLGSQNSEVVQYERDYIFHPVSTVLDIANLPPDELMLTNLYTEHRHEFWSHMHSKGIFSFQRNQLLSIFSQFLWFDRIQQLDQQSLDEAESSELFRDSSTQHSENDENSLHELRPKKIFACPTCGKSYDRQIRATRCFEHHSNPNPFLCHGSCGESDCSKAYGSQDSLNRHRNECKENKVSCDSCGKRHLQLHQKKYCSGLSAV